MATQTAALHPPSKGQIARAIAGGLPAELSQSPLVGILGVVMGAGIVTLTGRMLTLGTADLKGALGIGYDDGAWIGSAYNIALMFIGPFTVYVGGLLGARKVLLLAATSFTADLRLSSVHSQLQPVAHRAGARWSDLRHFLSPNANVRAKKYSAALSSVHTGALRLLGGRRGEHRADRSTAGAATIFPIIGCSGFPQCLRPSWPCAFITAFRLRRRESPVQHRQASPASSTPAPASRCCSRPGPGPAARLVALWTVQRAFFRCRGFLAGLARTPSPQP